MAWFSRGTSGSDDAVAEAAADVPGRFPAAEESLIDDSGMGPLRPRAREIGPGERARIDLGLSALDADGVDCGDLTALGAAYDAAFRDWADGSKRQREDHDVIVDRFAMGIGEHLTRTTDLRWRVVTDVFGTDLAVADKREGDFVVVPGNLVASRWMRGETGWIPKVVGHLISVRSG